MEQTCSNLPYGDGVTCGPNPAEELYAGLERDSESGLDHAMFRQYSSTYGRWVTPDPYNGSYNWANPQSLNRYAYVGGSPFGARDPSGLMPIEATLCFPYCAPPVVSNSFLASLLSLIGGPVADVVGIGGIVYDAGQIIGLWGVAPTFHGSVAASQAGKYVPNAPRTNVSPMVSCGARCSGAITPSPGLEFGVAGGIWGLADGLFADGVATGVGDSGAALTSGQLGQAGESAVQDAYDIGSKVRIDINGRVRIPDGLTDSTLSEVKNVAYQSFTRQLRDYLDYSLDNELDFNLYLRPTTRISGPLQDAIDNGLINRLYIPQ